MFTSVRTSAKGLLRRHWYPILLPHHRITDAGLSTLGAESKSLSPTLACALSLCDGAHTLAQIAETAGISLRQLVEQDHAGTLLLWPHRPWTDDHAARPPRTGVILSPHLDDAALSMGAAMLVAGNSDSPIAVIDVFSRVSWWRFDLADDVLPRVQETRDAEEALVMRIANCELHRWGLAEAPLRGYPLKQIFTTSRGPEAAATHETIRSHVREFARVVPPQRWFLPLGIGNHIDHRIARDAALDALRDAAIRGDEVRFYEDLPYAAQQPGVQDYSEFLATVMPGCRLRPEPGCRVDRLKQRLLRVYWSQLTNAQIASVHEYARRVNRVRPCERLWRFDPSTLARTNAQIPPLGPLV